ncbi:MAG: molybdopterin cofactor-binding domain-containing protein [Roseiflexaceae bacterium]|nr:molybdopterin cofactor-binding domain-containing protein [Roseiflexaceae bacterium]
MTTPKRRWRMSRRGFLIGVGVSGAGLVLGVTLAPKARLQIAAVLDSGASQPASVAGGPDAWFEITPDNQVTFYATKVEMGQGIHTALAQIAAEELEISWDQLTVKQATTNIGPQDANGTSGSMSVSSLYKPLREASATMREMLRAEAARKLGVNPTDLQIIDGVVALKSDPTKQLTYGQIVQGVAKWDVPKEAPALKSPDQFRYIGKPIPRVDFLAKLTGQAIYGYDARLPNMLYGAIARPPTIGATLKSANAGDAQAQPGVVTVVNDGNFAGVVAETRLQAYAGLAAMQLEWNEGQVWQQADIEARITVGQGSGVTIQEQGDADGQLRGAILTAEFRTPIAVHAHLEAQAALAEVQADSARVWVSTQFPSFVRTDVANAIGLKPEQVEVIPTFLGGGFGRKFGVDVAVEAARLAKASGRPVHVGWSRTEDMRHGYFRPPTHHILKGIVEGGRIKAIEHQLSSGHISSDFLPRYLSVFMGGDFGAWRGAMVPYTIPNIKTVAWSNELPIPTGWWRGLGLLPNNFAVESFIDELAHSANIDPLQFRLAQLPDGERGPRYKAVLEKVAELSNWNSPAAAGRGRGLAVCTDAGTMVAHVAEVAVEGNAIRVLNFWSAVDPGLAINPDGIKAQTEGSIVMGLSSTLIEELTVKDGQISASNFDGYPLITMKDIPQIEVAVLSNGDVPHGMGEPAIGPVAAAVANAVFALTGKRLRQLPLKLV